MATDVADTITQYVSRFEKLVAITLSAAAVGNVDDKSKVCRFASITVGGRVIADRTVAVGFIAELADFYLKGKNFKLHSIRFF